jgi:murein DD-endopeptidase MepM/ murein hydrolase activator NlpD
MFGVSANTILWANDIPRGGALKIGQQLVILPVSGIQYTVKKGDTVASLAKKYSADAEEIKSFNGIEGGLTVGDEIVIPNGVEPTVPVVSAVKKFIANITSSYVQTNGYFIRPAKGSKTQGLHGKNGVDFSFRGGPDVVAAADGEVVVSASSGYNGGYGHYIVIKHSNGTQTLYGHLNENLVAAGATVSQGQLIGKIGNTGRSSGPHLHFEVRGGVNPF